MTPRPDDAHEQQPSPPQPDDGEPPTSEPPNSIAATRYSCTGITLYSPTASVPPRCFGVRSKFLSAVLDLPPVPGSGGSGGGGSSAPTRSSGNPRPQKEGASELREEERIAEMQSHDLIELEDAGGGGEGGGGGVELDAWCLGYSRYTPEILLALERQRTHHARASPSADGAPSEGFHESGVRGAASGSQLAVPVCRGFQAFSVAPAEDVGAEAWAANPYHGGAEAIVGAAEFLDGVGGENPVAEELHVNTQKWLEGYARTKDIRDPRDLKDLVKRIYEQEDTAIRRFRHRELERIQRQYYARIEAARSAEEKMELVRAAQLATQAVHMLYPPRQFDVDAILAQMHSHDTTHETTRRLPHVARFREIEARREEERRRAEEHVEEVLAGDRERREDARRHWDLQQEKQQEGEAGEWRPMVPGAHGPRAYDAEEEDRMVPSSPSYLDKIQTELQQYDAARISALLVSGAGWTYSTWAALLDGFPARFEHRARTILNQMPTTLHNFVTQPPIIMKTVGTYVEAKFHDFVEEVMRDDDDDDY